MFGPHVGLLLINAPKQQTYKSGFNTEMKQDEYSTAKSTLKRWSNRATEAQQLNPSGPEQRQASSPDQLK